MKIACSTDRQSHSLKRHTDLQTKGLSASNIIGKHHDRSVAPSNRSARTSFSYHTLKAKMILTLVSIAISMENTLASGSIALTDATFSSAISSYLGESEAAAIDGTRARTYEDFTRADRISAPSASLARRTVSRKNQKNFSSEKLINLFCTEAKEYGNYMLYDVT